MHDYTEDSLVEQPAIELFKELGWETANCYNESFDSTLMRSAPSPLPSPRGRGRIRQIYLGRATTAEVVLVSRLRPALERLNPDAPKEAINDAIEQLTRDRRAMTPAQANREVYKLIKDGVRVKAQSATRTLGPSPSGRGKAERPGEGDEVLRIRVIDWDKPENNDFFLASQFWITGDMYKRRADLIGFVNGLPLVFIELKKLRIEHAFKHNLRDYKNTVPQLFWYNSLIILSNGSKGRIGSITGNWDHFTEWNHLSEPQTLSLDPSPMQAPSPQPSPKGRGSQTDSLGEGADERMVGLETMIRGTCEPRRLLDLAENFALFSERKGGLQKLVAMNHQYLGVNKAIAALQRIMLQASHPQATHPLPNPLPNPLPEGEGDKSLADRSSTTHPLPNPPRGRGR